jgi:hypothetical protein
MTHRHAIVKDGKFASLLRDAKELLALLPPPCADAGAEGIAELLLRIKFNAHPIRDSRQRRIGVVSFHPRHAAVHCLTHGSQRMPCALIQNPTARSVLLESDCVLRLVRIRLPAPSC